MIRLRSRLSALAVFLVCAFVLTPVLRSAPHEPVLIGSGITNNANLGFDLPVNALVLAGEQVIAPFAMEYLAFPVTITDDLGNSYEYATIRTPIPGCVPVNPGDCDEISSGSGNNSGKIAAYLAVSTVATAGIITNIHFGWTVDQELSVTHHFAAAAFVTSGVTQYYKSNLAFNMTGFDKTKTCATGAPSITAAVWTSAGGGAFSPGMVLLTTSKITFNVTTGPSTRTKAGYCAAVGF